MRTAVVQQIRTVKEIKEQSKKSRPNIEQKKNYAWKRSLFEGRNINTWIKN